MCLKKKPEINPMAMLVAKNMNARLFVITRRFVATWANGAAVIA
jgi:hypothetical protein